jgi:uncharacterized protein (TIGR00288 family)
MTDKVAIFLDVENLSGWLKADGGEALLERANELGRVVVRRAYGDFSIPSVSARQTELNLLGFEFAHVYHPARGKNSADIQIVVDVMEYLARIPDLEWIVLATGDSDFSPLFRRLRELGKSVVGVGPRSVLSEAVKKSCNRFIYIDENPNTNDLSLVSKTSQLREEALEILDRILEKFPDGISLSALKNSILEVDSAFDEQNLGFGGFMKFLQSAPETVVLYQVGQIWHAKSKEADMNQVKSIQATTGSTTAIKDPTVDLYRRLLRKNSWKACEPSFLCEALGSLKARFTGSFTRSQEFEYLIEIFGRSRTRGELRSVIYLLYKTGYVIQDERTNDDETLLIISSDSTEKEMAEKVDLVLINRLVKLCQSHDVPIYVNVLASLLNNNSYDLDVLEGLIDNAKHTCS